MILFCRHDAQDAPRRIVCKQVERPVRSLPYVADAFVEIFQKALLPSQLFALELEPR